MYTTPPTLVPIEKIAPDEGRNTTGIERRDLLLRTTLNLIAEEGIAAVTHRSVAEAAGVPLGSTTYWFRSREQMLTDSLRDFVIGEIAAVNLRLGALLAGDPARDDLADEFVALLMTQLGEDRSRTVAQYTLFQEAIRNPELEIVCREWTAAWHRALTGLFAGLGARSPELEARMILAMLDGLILGQLATPDADPERNVIRPAIEAWLARIPVGVTQESE